MKSIQQNQNTEWSFKSSKPRKDPFNEVELSVRFTSADGEEKLAPAFWAGGIDKMEIARGKQTIEKELYAKIPPLLEQGGYIPFLDHAIPPDISYRDFMYYMELKLKLMGR